jgi:hypothetical protein
MLRCFWGLAVLGIIAVALSCGGDPARPTCIIAIAQADQTRTIGADGSSFGIGVQAPAGCGWTATATGGFLTITAGSSGSGNGNVQVAASANGGVARLGTVVVGTATASVTQQAAPAPACAFEVTPTSASIGSAGGPVAVAVTVTQGIGCAWTAVSSDAFVSVANGASGVGNGTVNLAIAANTAGARTGTAMIAGRTVAIAQDAVPPVSCNYAVTPALTSVGVAGGVVTLNVTTGAACPWQPAKLFNVSAPFLTVLDVAARTGNGSFRVQAAPNQGTSRVDTVQVTSTQPSVGANVVQDELPGACQVQVSPPAFQVPSAGQTISLTVDLVAGTKALCPIGVRDLASPNGFLPSISSSDWVQNPSGPTTLQIKVPANTGSSRFTFVAVSWGFRIVGTDIFTHHDVLVNVTQFGTSPEVSGAALRFSGTRYQADVWPLLRAPDRIALRRASIVAKPPGAVPPHSNRVAAGVQ